MSDRIVFVKELVRRDRARLAHAKQARRQFTKLQTEFLKADRALEEQINALADRAEELGFYFEPSEVTPDGDLCSTFDEFIESLEDESVVPEDWIEEAKELDALDEEDGDE